MDFREIVGMIALLVSTCYLWTAAAIDRKDPIRWSGYVVAAGLATVIVLATTITMAEKFANFICDTAFLMGVNTATKNIHAEK